MSPPPLSLALLYCLAILSDTPTVAARTQDNSRGPPSVPADPAEGNAVSPPSVRVDAAGIQVIPVGGEHEGPSLMQDDPIGGNVKGSSRAQVNPVEQSAEGGGDGNGGDGAGGDVSLSEFMEEMRGAMSSQWELLQNLRYHTLGIKARLAQVESHLHALASSTRSTASGEREKENN